MLRAILQGKAGRIVSSEGNHSWRDLFRHREDLLTSVFFSRIPYLSPDAIGGVMAALISQKHADELGAFHEMRFWPKLPTGAGRRFVEPDVLIEFENATILVEVKPPSGGGQRLAQWKAEIEALLLDDRQANETGALHFIALGRNAPEWKAWKTQLELDFSTSGLTVHAIEWQDVCAAVTALANTGTSGDRAVYSDWIEAFALYGLVKRARPFDEILGLGEGITDDWRTLYLDYPRLSCLPVWHPLAELTNRTTLKAEEWQ